MPSKISVIIILLCALCSAFGVSLWSPLNLDDQEDQIALVKFQNFITKFNKQYESKEEFMHRFGIFKDNLVKIEHWQKMAEVHNSKGRSGITKYADVTEEEFKSTMLMPPSNSNLGDPEPCNVGTTTEVYSKPITFAVPASFDWRSKGAVTEVKDQGSVGTCWAFSTTGNIEGQWFLAGNQLVSLSEEQLNDCDGYDCGVFGGYPCRAFEYVINVGGLVSEQAYPYCVGTGDCMPCSPPGYNETFCGPGPSWCNTTQGCKVNQQSNFAAKVTGWKAFPDPTNESDLAVALVELGPLSVCMDAGSGIPPLQYHEYGVYDPWDCDPQALDHAVLLVGYGVYSDTPYWLVKNSWGTDWSDLDGYFMIARGSGMCGINRWPATAKV